jgi:hypothetical protein
MPIFFRTAPEFLSKPMSPRSAASSSAWTSSPSSTGCVTQPLTHAVPPIAIKAAIANG